MSATKRIVIKLTVDQLLASDGEIVIEVAPPPPPPSAPASCAPGILALLREVEADCRTQQRIRTAETYRAALNSFTRFLLKAHSPAPSVTGTAQPLPSLVGEGSGVGSVSSPFDIPITAFDSALALQYEQWLHQQGVCSNTCSFYMRRLRAVYNRAVARSLTPDRRPFDRVYTGVARTRKRAIGISVLRRLESLDLADDADARFARDMFLFSFYAQGMPFVDMAWLRRSDIHAAQLVYRRRKTGQTVTIAWTPRLQAIAHRYPPLADPFLLPIIRSRKGRERSQMRRCQLLVNTKLGELSQRLGLPSRLTLYVARHSWASIAQEIGIPLPVISRAMGHTSERTTRIYLADVSADRVAAANRQVEATIHGQE